MILKNMMKMNFWKMMRNNLLMISKSTEITVNSDTGKIY